MNPLEVVIMGNKSRSNKKS